MIHYRTSKISQHVRVMLVKESDTIVRPVRTPEEVCDMWFDTILPRDDYDNSVEQFVVFVEDAKNNVRHTPIISKGILDAAFVHPREVYRLAISLNAAGIVLAHNHPTGDPTPSAEDISVTRKLVKAGQVVDIPIMDHVIIGDSSCRKFTSLRESGLVEF